MNGLNDVGRYYNGNIEELRGRKDPEAIKIVAREMEKLFAYEMIKAMRETTGMSSKNDLGGSTYTGMFDMELARLFSERGLGLQEMLLKGLNRIAEKSENQDKDTAISNRQASVSSRQPLPDSQKPISSPVPYIPHSSAPPVAGAVVKTENPSSEALQPVQTLNVEPHSPLSLPVDGRISSGFGMRKHPVYGGKKFHYGIDIAAPKGTDVYPIKEGKVIFSGEKSGYGNMVVIQHEDGFISKYAHNEVNLVAEGDTVDSGTVIAQVGSTGNSTGPHLHFEVSYRGEKINPLQVVAIG